MKVLVTGSKGMLGQDLCPILENVGAFVIETDVDTLDITDSETVHRAIEDIRPDLVIHCAAYTNVDKAQEDLKTAELINVNGTENIADACAKSGITLVYISTDYVFDGESVEPYTIEDMPNPINNYGMTKYEGEEAVRSLCEKYYIVRTSWMYGHHGNNFVEIMLNMADKPEIKVVDDQIGCPTWTVELANGILKLLSKPYGTYHVCGSGFASRYEFAKEIFKLAGLNANVIPCKSDEFPRPAARPPFSAMENDGICRNWKAALKDYMELRNL